MTIGVLDAVDHHDPDDRDAAGQGADPPGLGVGLQARDEAVGLGRGELGPGGRRCSAGMYWRGDVEPAGQGDLGGRGPDHAVGDAVEDAVAVGPLDLEEVDLGRERDAGREVALDPDRGDEAGPPERSSWGR